MRRRDLLEVLGAAAAVPLLGPLPPGARLHVARALHDRLRDAPGWRALDPRQGALVAELAEAIIPATDSPGAKAVRVPEFIDLLLADWYSPDERSQFLAGLDAIEARAGQRFGRGLLEVPPDQRAPLLAELDAAQGDPGTAEAAFHRIKSLTVYGYFTSREVLRDVLHYEVIPGQFVGCVPLEVR